MKSLTEVKDIKQALTKFKGYKAKMWKYHVSLKRLALHLYAEEKEEVAYIISLSTNYISGNTSWENADLFIDEMCNGQSQESVEYKVFDSNAKFSLISSGGIIFIFGKEKDILSEYKHFLALD